ncbi:hypothetical protein ACH5RR_022820 [Cinchona calisaya]|uniref:Agenet domain-containing protein n=1 Tax=Cinchona calisaya TaxID=153742 RepID=A0ABD2Z9Y3_9GENT
MDYFKKGVEVEISSEENGFQGSWYAGTVVRKSRDNKILLQYKDLLEDDGGHRPLREEIDFLLLRPPAPRETYREFKLGEDVDAYCNEGWWEGVITQVTENGNKFGVYFRNSREQLDFRPSELRLHREWVHGSWVPPLEVKSEEVKEVLIPAKKEPGEETFLGNFSQGAPVEVSSNEDGFKGAWLPATVIKKLDKDKYIIQYQSLRNDDDTEFLKEEVDNLHMRPQPPVTAIVDCFKVHQEVDALFNDCWWVGVVSKVLEDKTYTVYFRGTEDEMEFKHSELRQHQDWIDGKWVIPSQAMKF